MVNSSYKKIYKAKSDPYITRQLEAKIKEIEYIEKFYKNN